MNAVDVRQKPIEGLCLDFVGLGNGSALAPEIPPQSPSRWCLAGLQEVFSERIVRRRARSLRDED